MDVTTLYSIGERSRRTGLSVRTIRFYSDSGVVAPTINRYWRLVWIVNGWQVAPNLIRCTPGSSRPCEMTVTHSHRSGPPARRL